MYRIKLAQLSIFAAAALTAFCGPAVIADDVPTNTIVSERTGKSYKVKNSRAPKPKKKKIKVYKYKEGRVTSFTDRPPMGQEYEVLSFKCFACDVNSKIDWYSIRIYPDKFAEIIDPVSNQYGVDPALVRAVIHAESAFRPSVKSHKGAVGLMQLMPATAKELGVVDRTNPEQNIDGGVKYLAQLLKTFEGDIKLATAAYNAGPNAVRRYGGIPPYPETEAYVERVEILAKRYNES